MEKQWEVGGLFPPEKYAQGVSCQMGANFPPNKGWELEMFELPPPSYHLKMYLNLLWKMVMLGCYVSFNECIPGCPSYIHTIQFTCLLLMATSPCHKDILMFSSFNLMLWSVLMRYMKINMEQNDAGLLQMVVLCKTGDFSRFLAVNFFVRGVSWKLPAATLLG